MLQNFAEKGYLGYFSGNEAPKQIGLEVSLDDNWLDDLSSAEYQIKMALEDVVGLKVKHFNFTIF